MAAVHYIISCDFSGTAGYAFTPAVDFDPGFYTFDHSDFRFWTSVDDTDYSPTSFLFYNLVEEVEVTGPAGLIEPFRHDSAPDGDVSLPSFTIQINGLEAAIPVQAANALAGDNSIVQIADFMMWTGVSLDTSVIANRRLFIDAAGNPVNPDVAIAALGTPVYHFSGPASGIATNLGSAGNPTKAGTVTDYTPGP